MCLSSVLSIGGSSLILGQIIVGKRYRKNCYHRLLFALSCADVINTIRFLWIPFVYYPIDEPSAACTAVGFFAVMGFSSAAYISSLSFFYVLTVRFNVKEQKMRRFVEPIFHIVSIGCPLISSLTGIGLQVYNPSEFGLGCWTTAYPAGCVGEECERGQHAKIFVYMVAVLPQIIIFLSTIINNVIIFWTVRSLEKRTGSYGSAEFREKQRQRQQQEERQRQQQQKQAERAELQHQSSSSSSTALESAGAKNMILRKISNVRSQNSCREKTKRSKRSRKVAIQSFLYIAAYLACWIWGVVFFTLSAVYPDSIQSGRYYWMQVLDAIFFPLQGAFNCVFYLRPRYLQWRRVTNRKGAVMKAAFSLELPSKAMIIKARRKRMIRRVSTAQNKKAAVPVTQAAADNTDPSTSIILKSSHSNLSALKSSIRKAFTSSKALLSTAAAEDDDLFALAADANDEEPIEHTIARLLAEDDLAGAESAIGLGLDGVSNQSASSCLTDLDMHSDEHCDEY